MDWRDNKLSPELLPQAINITISLFLSWEATQQWLWEWLQEDNLQVPVSKDRGRSSEGKHNTDPVQKCCISRAYTADVATSTFGGSHQRTGSQGRRTTAQKQSVWTHAYPNLHRIFQTCCTCPLATKMVSSWFHIVAFEAFWGFAQQPSCRFRLCSYRQRSSGGRGLPRYSNASLDLLVP